MLDQFVPTWGFSWVFHLGGRGWNPAQPVLAAYDAAYLRATSGEGFGPEVLREELQKARVPGAYGDGTGVRVSPAFDAWAKQLPPKKVYRHILHFKG